MTLHQCENTPAFPLHPCYQDWSLSLPLHYIPAIRTGLALSLVSLSASPLHPCYQDWSLSISGLSLSASTQTHGGGRRKREKGRGREEVVEQRTV